MENDTTLICPYCGAENPEAARNCAHCGEALIRVCPRCNTINAITAEHCPACGQQLDVLGHIMARNEIRFTDRFTRHAENVSGVKEQETTQAKQRTDQLWEPERQRQATLAGQQQKQKLFEQRLLMGVIVFAIIVIVAIILLSFVR